MRNKNSVRKKPSGSKILPEKKSNPTLQKAGKDTVSKSKVAVKKAYFKKIENERDRFASFPLLNPNPVLEIDSSGRITFYNDAAVNVLIKLKLKKDINSFLPEDIHKILKALNQKKEKQFYREITIKERIFGEVLYLAPQFNSVRIYANDITERKKKEVELHRLNRTLRALSNSAQTMLYARNEQELLEEACRIIIEVCGHKMVWIGFAEDDEHKTVRPVAYAGFEEGYLKTLNITWADTDRGRGPTGTAIRTGQPAMCRNMMTDPAFEPWRIEAASRGYASSAVLPLIDGSRTFGAISIYSRDPNPFTEEEVKLLSELAINISYGITTIRLRVTTDLAKEALRKAHDELEMRVQQRTEELNKANKELREAKENLQNTLESISDGFFTLDKQWHYTYLNSKAGMLVGRKSEELLGKSIWEEFPDAIDSGFYQMFYDAMTTGETVHFEEYYPPLKTWFEGSIYPFSDGLSVYFHDVTGRKMNENRIKATNDLLKFFAVSSSRKDYIGSVIELLQEWTGCCCIGIRVLDRQGNIPYESYTGFSQEFWQSENWISLKNHQCACIRVMLEKPEPQDFPAMTPFGSFRSDNTIDFLETLSEEEQSRFRGLCIKTGFKSVAIVPIRYQNTVLGAVHLADKREGLVPLEKIQFIESITTLIGEAIQRFNLEEELHENYFTQSAINMILSVSLENISLDEFLKKALYMILSIPWLSPESSGCIHLVEDKPDVLVMKSQNNLSESLVRLCAHVPFGKCICGQAALTQQLQFADHGDDRHEICDKELPPHSHYAVPILFGGRTLGVINVYLDEQHIMNQKEVEFLQNIANTMAGIIVRKQAEEEINESRKQLRELYTHLQSVREEERTHIAREIHDEFGTILTALKIDLSWLEKKLHGEQKFLVERAQKDIELINSAIKTVQRISSELRPGILDHLGLAAAVEWQVKEFAGRTGLNWDTLIDIEKDNHNRDLSTAVFRICQEALTNIARHAEATKVHVSLIEKNGLLVLEIIDNGKGVTSEKLSDPHSFGLMGMRERVQGWGGSIMITGIENKGTTVTVSIPLDNKGQEK